MKLALLDYNKVDNGNQLKGKIVLE